MAHASRLGQKIVIPPRICIIITAGTNTIFDVTLVDIDDKCQNTSQQLKHLTLAIQRLKLIEQMRLHSYPLLIVLNAKDTSRLIVGVQSGF